MAPRAALLLSSSLLLLSFLSLVAAGSYPSHYVPSSHGSPKLKLVDRSRFAAAAASQSKEKHAELHRRFRPMSTTPTNNVGVTPSKIGTDRTDSGPTQGIARQRQGGDGGTIQLPNGQFVSQVTSGEPGQTQPLPPLNFPGGSGITLDFTSLFLSAGMLQLNCAYCWAFASLEHIQAVATSLGFTSPNTGKPYELSIQQVASCVGLNYQDACDNGLTAYKGLEYMQTFFVVPWDNYVPLQVLALPCTMVTISTFANVITVSPGSNIAYNVVPPCFDDACAADPDKEQQMLEFMQSPSAGLGGTPLIAYVDVMGWADYNGGNFSIFTATQGCSNSGNPSLSHVVQVSAGRGGKKAVRPSPRAARGYVCARVVVVLTLIAL